MVAVLGSMSAPFPEFHDYDVEDQSPMAGVSNAVNAVGVIASFKNHYGEAIAEMSDDELREHSMVRVFLDKLKSLAKI